MTEKTMENSPYYNDEGVYQKPINQDEWMAQESKKAIIKIMITIDELFEAFNENLINLDELYYELQHYCDNTIIDLMDRFGYD